jgi:hypothetical protein
MSRRGRGLPIHAFLVIHRRGPGDQCADVVRRRAIDERLLNPLSHNLIDPTVSDLDHLICILTSCQVPTASGTSMMEKVFRYAPGDDCWWMTRDHQGPRAVLDVHVPTDRWRTCVAVGVPLVGQCPTEVGMVLRDAASEIFPPFEGVTVIDGLPPGWNPPPRHVA